MTVKDLKEMIDKFDDEDIISFNLFDEENRTIAHASEVSVFKKRELDKFDKIKTEVNLDIHINPKYGGTYVQMKLDYISKVNKCKSLEKTIHRLGNENKRLKESVYQIKLSR